MSQSQHSEVALDNMSGQTGQSRNDTIGTGQSFFYHWSFEIVSFIR